MTSQHDRRRCWQKIADPIPEVDKHFKDIISEFFFSNYYFI